MAWVARLLRGAAAGGIGPAGSNRGLSKPQLQSGAALVGPSVTTTTYATSGSEQALSSPTEQKEKLIPTVARVTTYR